MNKQNKVKTLTDSELEIRLMQLQDAADIRTNLEELLIEAELERRKNKLDIVLTTEEEVLDFLEGFDGCGLVTTDYDLIKERIHDGYVQ